MSLKSKHKVGVRFFTRVVGASLTKQSFADECNVDKVVEKFMKTGVMPNSNPREPQFVDVTGVVSFDEALRIVEAAESSFMALDPKVRFRFDNDPAEFVAFLSDGKNRGEAVSLGLVQDKRERVLNKDGFVRRSTDKNPGTSAQNNEPTDGSNEPTGGSTSKSK